MYIKNQINTWTSTIDADNTSYAWHIEFTRGSEAAYPYGTSNTYYVRCVRGENSITEATGSEFSRDSSKKVVTDSISGLMWQDDSAVKSKKYYYDDDVIGYCENLTLGRI